MADFGGHDSTPTRSQQDGRDSSGDCGWGSLVPVEYTAIILRSRAFCLSSAKLRSMTLVLQGKPLETCAHEPWMKLRKWRRERDKEVGEMKEED